MKRFVLLVLILFSLQCSTDTEESDTAVEAEIVLTGLTVGLNEVMATSAKLEYAFTSLFSSGGELEIEVWFRKPGESDWSKVSAGNEDQKILEIEGLERATKYLAKPVFKVNDVIEHGSELGFTTLPFNYTFVREKNPNALYITNIFNDDDYNELAGIQFSFLKKENDSIPLQTTIVSKDTLLLQATPEHQGYFEGTDLDKERLELGTTLQLGDYYSDNFATMVLYNMKPKIGQLSFQRIVDCGGTDRTKLLFQGLFWDSSLRPENDFNKPDGYTITISNAENPTVPLLSFTEVDNRTYGSGDGSINIDDFLGNNCDEGFTIVEDPPIRNAFHRGSFLWLSFPTEALPEGNYLLEFGITKNGEHLMAEPLVFNLQY